MHLFYTPQLRDKRGFVVLIDPPTAPGVVRELRGSFLYLLKVIQLKYLFALQVSNASSGSMLTSFLLTGTTYYYYRRLRQHGIRPISIARFATFLEQ